MKIIMPKPNTQIVPATPGKICKFSIGDDALFAAQLLAQYNTDLIAEGHAKRERAKTGVMLLIVRQRIDNSLLSIEKDGPGRWPKGYGMRYWLQEHCPAIGEMMASRRIKYATQLIKQSKLEDAAELERLLISEAGELAEPERLKQAELFETIEATSQTQLVAPNTPSRQMDMTEKEKQEVYERACIQDTRGAFNCILRLDEKWKVAPDADLHAACRVAEDFLKACRAWLKTPHYKRPDLDPVKMIDEATPQPQIR